MGCHFTPTTLPIAFYFKERNKMNFGEDVEKLELLYIVGGDTTGFTAVENSLLVPHKI